MPTSTKPRNEVRTSTGVRLKPEIRAKVKDLADERRWTISAYIEWITEQHIAALQPSPVEKSRPASKSPRSK